MLIVGEERSYRWTVELDNLWIVGHMAVFSILLYFEKNMVESQMYPNDDTMEDIEISQLYLNHVWNNGGGICYQKCLMWL